MESPPPYMPAPKKSNTGLIVGLILGGFFLCCLLPLGLLGGFGYFAFNKSKDMVSCIMAYQNVRDALVDYSQDHGGKLPPAAKWMDEVRPYYKKIIARAPDKDGQKVFGFMPAEGTWSCSDGSGGQTGMAFNSDLSGKKVADIKNPSRTYLVFETKSPAPNLNQKFEELPKDQSPKIFNSARGWIKVPVQGDVKTGNSTTRIRGGTTVETSTTVSSNSSDSDDDSSSDAKASTKNKGEETPPAAPKAPKAGK